MYDNLWCPYCSKYKCETLCHEIISKYLGQPSKMRQPEFLKTPEFLAGLKLDIFYTEYGFAVEVQREQHEKYVEFFHKGDPKSFIKQQAWDQFKKNCVKKLDCLKIRLVLRRPLYSYSRTPLRIGSH
ncbi:putative nuclease: PROVISIONAL [Gigaspora margarita]|uniref:Putative nuclease: PROVISIONAL n=1 Tax=Gigaspora margarita TaxID=4874 RepID=A0A8H4AH11_GIGMA|nr:putative nuclease: PROVISIONAL [Gigaspora margarita]